VRLDDELDRAIQNRARESNVSVNFLVNRCIRKYIEWDIPAEKFGLGPVAAILLNRLFDEVDEETSAEIGRWAAREFFAPFCRYLFGEFTFETSILTFRRASEYGSRYIFDTTSDARNRIIVLRHNGGQKISSFYAGIFKGIYSDILKMELNVESTRDYCVAQLRIR
jgi:predicted hydrocarbon binding protein